MDITKTLKLGALSWMLLHPFSAFSETSYLGAPGYLSLFDPSSLLKPNKAKYKAAIKQGPPGFYLKNGAAEYPVASSLNERGIWELRLDETRLPPTGDYTLFAHPKKRNKDFVLGYRFRVAGPFVTHSQKDPNSGQVKVSGVYFGNSPTLSIIHSDHGQEVSTPLVISELKNDPTQGTSSFSFSLPNGYAFEEAAIRVDSGSGAGIFKLNADQGKAEGDFIGYEPRGLIEADDADEYAVVSSASGIDGWLMDQITIFMARVLWQDSPLKHLDGMYDVRMYNIRYLTQSAGDKSLVDASGVVVVPVTPKGSSQKLDLLAYQHGTIFEIKRSPSTASAEADLGMAVALSSAMGVVTVVPDYQGLGIAAIGKSVTHPYCQYRPLTRDVGNMLLAVQNMFADPLFKDDPKNQPIPQLSGRLKATGYSEGGYVTLGLGLDLLQNLKTYKLDRFVAMTPGAGPYSMAGTMRDLMVKDSPLPLDGRFYAPYVTITMNNTYKGYRQASDYLEGTYATELPILFNGNHSGEEVNKMMPAIVKNIINKNILDGFIKGDPTSILYNYLDVNDLAKASYPSSLPDRPSIHLIHGGEDDLVPEQNTVYAETQLRTENWQKVDKEVLKTSTEANILKRIKSVPYHVTYFYRWAGSSWRWLKDHN